MNFDIKDVKSWYNRHDVKVGDEGYFFNNIKKTLDNSFKKGMITEINDDRANCFVGAYDYLVWDYNFFLPLEAVKEDKPGKKYRPIRNMTEFSYILGGTAREVPFSVGDRFLIRRKQDKHQLKILLTTIEFNDNHEIVFINGTTPQALLEDYELEDISGKFIPFGVEVKDDE